MKVLNGIVILLGVTLLLNGCAMSWRAAWEEPAAGLLAKHVPDVPRPEAAALFETARDGESLQRAIAAYRDLNLAEPGDYQILTRLSTMYILLGTAYTDSRREKSQSFHQAMVYAERAMYTNPDFRVQVDSGCKPWEAAGTLTGAEAEAMFFWVTALQYDFKEGMTLPGKIVNLVWLKRSLVFLKQIETVAPDFGGGAVEFAQVICFYALPTWWGGSKSLGEEYMRRAVERGEGWLLPRWARGKYFYPIRGDDVLARQDLEWVASRDPQGFRDASPWRIHFQDDARRLLR
jgi:hypothetical protein